MCIRDRIDDGSPYDLINTKTLSDLFNISIKVIEQEGYWRMLPLATKQPQE